MIQIHGDEKEGIEITGNELKYLMRRKRTFHAIPTLLIRAGEETITFARSMDIEYLDCRVKSAV
jgi:hypothetical protein